MCLEHDENKINELSHCLTEKYFHVQLSSEDHFACDNYDSLWIISILKEHV